MHQRSALLGSFINVWILDGTCKWRSQAKNSRQDDKSLYPDPNHRAKNHKGSGVNGNAINYTKFMHLANSISMPQFAIEYWSILLSKFPILAHWGGSRTRPAPSTASPLYEGVIIRDEWAFQKFNWTGLLNFGKRFGPYLFGPNPNFTNTLKRLYNSRLKWPQLLICGPHGNRKPHALFGSFVLFASSPPPLILQIWQWCG